MDELTFKKLFFENMLIGHCSELVKSLSIDMAFNKSANDPKTTMAKIISMLNIINIMQEQGIISGDTILMALQKSGVYDTVMKEFNEFMQKMGGNEDV